MTPRSQNTMKPRYLRLECVKFSIFCLPMNPVPHVIIVIPATRSSPLRPIREPRDWFAATPFDAHELDERLRECSADA